MKALLSLPRRARVLLLVLLALAFAAGALASRRLLPDGEMLYRPVRAGTIRAQAETMARRQAVMIGDSRTDLLHLGRMRGGDVLNAGIGGSTVADWRDLAPDLVARADPAEVIVALGVNDARRAGMPPFERWRADYRRLVASLRGGGRRLVLVQVSPVARNGVRGAAYFDPERIAAINREIALVAAETGAALVPPLPSVEGLTSDGVHFTPEAAARWRATIAEAR